MSRDELDQVFETFIKQPRDDMTQRQQFWMAFEAGAKYAIRKLSEATIPSKPNDERP